MTRQEKVNLLNELLEIEEKNDVGNLTSTDRREFQQWVEDLEQEPKTGHWIHFAQSDDCSECRWSTGKYISPSKYCPNCGAKMVEPDESEDKK